jgi:hypothetical protein
MRGCGAHILPHTSALLLVLMGLLAFQAPATRKPEPSTLPLPLEEMKGKQAVLETTAGTIVIDLLPEAAPNHIAYFTNW